MPSPSSDARDQIRARLDLIEIVQGHLRLTRKGREWVGLCPFHQENTPSFNVNQQKQTWICRGCGKGGDLFDFIEEIDHTDFRGALAILAERAGVELERDPAAHQRSELRRRILDLNRTAVRYYEYVLHSSPAGEPGRQLLAERGVTEETAQRFGIGFAPASGDAFASFVRKRGLSIPDALEAGLVIQGGRRDFFASRLVIPIRDERGAPLAFTGRTIDPGEARKYVNSKESLAYFKGRVLFGLDLAREAIGRRGHAVLVEGQFDVISAHQHGVANAVASSGTALTEDHVRLLSRFTEELLLVFDADAAGRKATQVAIERCLEQGLRSRVVTLEGAKDPDEYFRAQGDAAMAGWEAAVERSQPEWEHLLRQSVAGLNLATAGDLGLATEHIKGVLAKITDPSMRDAYEERAGKWFGIERHFLTGPPRKSRSNREMGPSPPKPVDRLMAEPKGNEVTSGRYLLQILAVRPEAVELVRGQLQPEHMAEEERGTYLKMLETIDGGGADALQRDLMSFAPSAQEIIRGAWADPPLGAQDDEMIHGMVIQIQRDWRRRQLAAVTSQLAEAEKRGDRELALTLEAEHGAMARALQALNNRAHGG